MSKVSERKELPGEYTEPLETYYPTLNDWSALAHFFRQCFSCAARLPVEIVRLIVSRMETTDLLAVARVSKAGSELAKLMAKCVFCLADFGQISALLTGRTALFRNEASDGYLRLNRDGTFCIFSSLSSRASMGRWLNCASLMGEWRVHPQAKLIHVAVNIKIRDCIILEAKQWSGRMREEWYAMSEHAPMRLYEEALANGMDMTNSVSYHYTEGLVADSPATYCLKISGLSGTLDSPSGALNPFSYCEKADSCPRQHKWLHEWEKSELRFVGLKHCTKRMTILEFIQKHY